MCGLETPNVAWLLPFYHRGLTLTETLIPKSCHIESHIKLTLYHAGGTAPLESLGSDYHLQINIKMGKESLTFPMKGQVLEDVL